MAPEPGVLFPGWLPGPQKHRPGGDSPDSRSQPTSAPRWLGAVFTAEGKGKVPMLHLVGQTPVEQPDQPYEY